MVAARVRVVASSRERVLRRDDEPLSLRLDERSDDRLALAVRVVAGRVDEVPARLDEGLEHPTALLLGGTPTPGLAECHGAERELGDPQAAPAEKRVAHHSSSVPMMSATSAAACICRCSARDVRVCAGVSLERDEPGVAELREVVVHGRSREAGRVDEVGGTTDAPTDEREDLDPLRIRERTAEGEQAFLAVAICGRGR